MVRPLGALVLGVALLGAACGDDDSTTTQATTVLPTATTTATSSAATTATTAGTTTSAGGGTTTSASGGSTTTARGGTTTSASGGSTTTAGGGSTTSSGGATTTAAGGGAAVAVPTGVTCKATSLAFFGALTGDNANLGINIQRGAKLAVDQFNAANPNCKVTLKDLDSQGSPDKAPDLAKQAIDDASVVGVIGPAFSGESNAAGPLFSEAGLATITPSATRVDLAKNGWKTFNRLLGNDGAQGPGIASYIKKNLANEKVFVVDDSSDYGKGLADIVRQDLGSQVVGTDKAQEKQTDFASTVSKVKDSGAKVVFYGGYYAEAGNFAKQLKEGGVTATFVAGDGVKDPGFVQTAGPANAEGSVISCTCAPAELSPAFLTAYKAANGGADPQTYGPEAYDAAIIYLKGLAAGSADRAAMITFVRGYTGKGVTKTIKFDQNGEVEGGAVYIYKVQNGTITGAGTA